MSRPFYTLIISIIILYGCTRKSDLYKDSISLDDFGPLIVLENPDTIKLEANLYRIKGFAIYNDHLFISDDYDTIIRVFKYPTFEYVSGLVLKGRGPMEMTAPRASGLYSTIDGVTIHGLDGRVFNIDIYEDSIYIKKRFKLPGEFFYCNFLFDLGDSVYYATDYTNPHKGEFISYNLATNIIGSFSRHPDFMSSIDENKRDLYSLGVITLKKDHSKFARFYMKFPVLRIYNRDGKEHNLVSIHNSIDIQTVEQTFPNEDIKYFFGGKLFSTDNRIYAEYKIHESTTPLVERQILVFDWDGNPLYRMSYDILKDISTRYFISEDDKTFYFVDDSSLNNLYKFDLNFSYSNEG